MRPQIYLFGDSITEGSFEKGGWGVSLANHFARTSRWPETTILLITPPPIDEAARLPYPYSKKNTSLSERTNEAAGDYAKACLAVAAECGVPSVDIWTEMQRTPGWQKAYLSDGLHLTEGGSTYVYGEVIERLEESGLRPENLATELPQLSEMDPHDPLKFFESFK